MENQYEDENIKADCKTRDEYLDGYNQPDEPFFYKDDP